MKTVIEMAREANDYATAALGVNAIPREWRALRDEQFAAIVRDDERRAIYVELDKTDSAVDEVLAEYKEAMQMALEALEKYNSKHRHTYGLDGAWDEEITKGELSITALREALAQPQVSDYDREFWGDGQPQENTARCGGCNKTAEDGWALYCVECWEKGNGQSATNEPAANAHVSNSDSDSLSYVKQEPVLRYAHIKCPVCDVENPGIHKCATPIRTKDLTDEEIWEVVKNCPVDNRIEAAKAAIAADREKNK